MSSSWIIGIDWATQPANIGLCLAERSKDGLRVHSLCLGSDCSSPVDQLAEWIQELSGPILLALDAPLGWPKSMGLRLYSHSAGEGIGVEANRFFRRKTDEMVWKRLGKLPLEVGADRIARAALSAVDMLEELRGITRLGIPLAWNATEAERVRVIEVYPAATLLVSGASIRGYKRKSPEAELKRESLSRGLEERIVLSSQHHRLNRATDHLLDATVCAIAGDDFLGERCWSPEDQAESKKEGWIWVSKEGT